jgi:hypothetical protein
MIDGFRIDVTAEELVVHLDGRIMHHHDRAEDCEHKLRQLHALAPAADEEEDALEICGASRVHGLERMVSRHRNRELFLMFARNHVVASEIYRLSEDDLRLLEWLPVEEASFMAGRF